MEEQRQKRKSFSMFRLGKSQTKTESPGNSRKSLSILRNYSSGSLASEGSQADREGRVAASKASALYSSSSLQTAGATAVYSSSLYSGVPASETNRRTSSVGGARPEDNMPGLASASSLRMKRLDAMAPVRSDAYSPFDNDAPAGRSVVTQHSQAASLASGTTTVPPLVVSVIQGITDATPKRACKEDLLLLSMMAQALNQEENARQEEEYDVDDTISDVGSCATAGFPQVVVRNAFADSDEEDELITAPEPALVHVESSDCSQYDGSGAVAHNGFKPYAATEEEDPFDSSDDPFVDEGAAHKTELAAELASLRAQAQELQANKGLNQLSARFEQLGTADQAPIGKDLDIAMGRLNSGRGPPTPVPHPSNTQSYSPLDSPAHSIAENDLGSRGSLRSTRSGVSNPSNRRLSIGSVDPALSSEIRRTLNGACNIPDDDWLVDSTEVDMCKQTDGTLFLLGEGQFGKVYKALQSGVFEVAAKVVNHKLREDVQREFLNEVAILRACRNPNMVQFLGACLQPESIMLLMEYMPGGNLATSLNLNPKEYVWTARGRAIALDIIKALHYLHTRNPAIIHFDFKSSNVLLGRDGTAKVADVGMARLKTDRFFDSAEPLGTFAYMAPELFTGDGVCEKVDIYSFGIVLWEIVIGDTRKGRSNLRNPRVGEECPQPVWDLVQQCTSVDPMQRPTALRVAQTLMRHQ